MQEHLPMPEQSYRVDQATRLRQIAMNTRNTVAAAGPHVITVTSGKGGVGKSTIALNLAIKFCDFGKRVLLVDADTNLGNLDVMLGITPKWRLGDLLRGEKRADEVIVSPHPGVSVLPGSSGDSNHPTLDAEVVGRIMDELTAMEERFDVVLVDTSAGLSPEIIAYAVNSDETIVVTNPEPTAIMDAYAVIKVISIAQPDATMHVLLNGARTPRDADEAARKLQMAISHFLKVDTTYLGSIPYDANVAKSIVQQRAVVQLFPMCGASLSVQNLAQRIVSRSLTSTPGRIHAWQ